MANLDGLIGDSAPVLKLRRRVIDNCLGKASGLREPPLILFQAGHRRFDVPQGKESKRWGAGVAPWHHPVWAVCAER